MTNVAPLNPKGNNGRISHSRQPSTRHQALIKNLFRQALDFLAGFFGTGQVAVLAEEVELFSHAQRFGLRRSQSLRKGLEKMKRLPMAWTIRFFSNCLTALVMLPVFQTPVASMNEAE